MKRHIAAASLALLAFAALSAPADAQSCSNNGNSRGFHGQGNAGWNSNFGGGFNTGYNTNFSQGIGFGNPYGNAYGNAFGNGFNRFGNIDDTQARLQARINAGINSGRLTQAESARLQARFAQIASLEAALRTSGNRLSFGERQRLSNQLARLNSDVTRQMNDFDGRIAHNGRFGWNRY